MLYCSLHRHDNKALLLIFIKKLKKFHCSKYFQDDFDDDVDDDDKSLLVAPSLDRFGKDFTILFAALGSVAATATAAPWSGWIRPTNSKRGPLAGRPRARRAWARSPGPK